MPHCGASLPFMYVLLKALSTCPSALRACSPYASAQEGVDRLHSVGLGAVMSESWSHLRELMSASEVELVVYCCGAILDVMALLMRNGPSAFVLTSEQLSYNGLMTLPRGTTTILGPGKFRGVKMPTSYRKTPEPISVVVADRFAPTVLSILPYAAVAALVVDRGPIRSYDAVRRLLDPAERQRGALVDVPFSALLSFAAILAAMAGYRPLDGVRCSGSLVQFSVETFGHRGHVSADASGAQLGALGRGGSSAHRTL
jgi:hypothetical protein